MFKVLDYEVNFTHYYDGKVRVTRCIILDTISGKETTGESRCNPVDQFVRNTGRKLSLAKALKEYGLPVEIRKLFWDEYFKVRGGKW
jgi:hypothetical protein